MYVHTYAMGLCPGYIDAPYCLHMCVCTYIWSRGRLAAKIQISMITRSIEHELHMLEALWGSSDAKFKMY